MDHFRRRYRSASPQRRTTLDDALLRTVCECKKPRCWKCLTALATLVLTESGAPIRTVVTGRRHQVTGVYASRKAGRALPYESMNERAFFMHSEVDTNVLDFRAQPFRLEFTVGDRPRAYIVDCVRQLSCGAIELIEVKNDRRALRDLDYQLKLLCVRAICEQVGWRFRIVLKQSLFEPELRYANILDVQSWKLTDYNETDVFCVVDHLDRHGPSPVGRLTELIGGPLVGAAKLKAMMVGRIVRLDLSKPLTPQTPVERVAQSRDRAEESQ